jgi:hypothetical protein
MKKIFLLVLISAFIAVSCEKVIEFKGEITQPLPVLYAFVQPDSLVFATLTSSEFFLAEYDSFGTIDNAEMKLFVNGRNIGAMMYNAIDLRYYSDYRTQSNDVIRIEISTPGFGNFFCENTVPQPAQIISLDTSVKINGNNTFYNISLKFQDNIYEKNYYRVVVFSLSESGLERLKIESDDNIFARENGENDILSSSNSYNVFKDELINGQEYTLKFDVSANVKNTSKIIIQLQTLSYDYYMYLKTRGVAESSGGIGAIFGEPVQIYSNVKGGVGILGTYSVSEKSCYLPALF